MDNVTYAVKTKAVVDALLVMVLTPHILEYLTKHDPMALLQATDALLAIGANPVPEVFTEEWE